MRGGRSAPRTAPRGNRAELLQEQSKSPQKPSPATPRDPAVAGMRLPGPRPGEKEAQQNLSSHQGALTTSRGHGLAKEILIYGLIPMLSMQSVQGMVHISYREPSRMEDRRSTSEHIQFGRFSTPGQGFSSSDLESHGAFRHLFFQEKGGKGTSRHSSSIQILCCSLLGSRALPGLQRTSWFGHNSTPLPF